MEKRTHGMYDFRMGLLLFCREFFFCQDGFKSVPTQGALEEQVYFSGAPSDVGLRAVFTQCIPPQPF